MFQYSIGGAVMTDAITYGQDCTEQGPYIRLCMCMSACPVFMLPMSAKYVVGDTDRQMDTHIVLHIFAIEVASASGGPL